MLLPALGAVLCALAAACKPGQEPVPSGTHQSTIAARGAAVEQLLSWPGGGAELVVRLEDRDGFPRTTLHGQDLALRWIDERDAPPVAVSRAVPSEQGYTALLLLPATTPGDAQHMALAVAAFVASRPPGEQVAVFRWGNTIDQLVGFRSDRADIARVLDRMPLRAAGAPVVAPAAALREAVSEVIRLGNPALHQPRHVVIVGHELPGALPSGLEQDNGAVVQWVLGDLAEDAIATLGRGRVVPWERHEDLGAALSRAGERLDAFRQAHYRIGVCGVGDGKIAAVEALAAAVDQSWLHVRIPPSLPEERHGTCDPHAISAGLRVYPDTIELVLGDDERAVYHDRMVRESREDFSLSVRFWPGGKAVKARAHLRGDGTFDCDRRNYNIKLRDKRPRHLMPGFAGSEIYLISMCADDSYLNAYTAYQLMSRLGLFPFAFRYVEVRVNGKSQGVYVLIEKAREALTSRHSRVRSVIRRRYEPDRTAPELKYAGAGQEAASSSYYQVLQALSGKSGDDLVQALEGHLDLHGYLDLLAFQALLQNGDYADEVWMVSTDRLRADGAIGDWFSFAGWDLDDILSECHYEGAYALVDRHGLSFCAEAEIDDRILADPAAYARYVDRLEQVLADISDEMFTQAALAAHAALLPYLRRPEVAAVMLGSPADAAAASEIMTASITAAATDLIEAFRQRRQLLQQRMTMYRSGQRRALTAEQTPAPGAYAP
jgi:spore coat protein H